MFDIPDKGTGASDIQSVLFSEYLDVMIAGIARVDCVLTGCAVTAQASPDMTVAVAAGTVLSNGALFSVTAGNVTIGAADANLPRLDLVVANSAGTKAVRAGTAAAAPKPPARTANDVVLAVVYVPAADTAINSNQIVDLRVFSAALARTDAANTFSILQTFSAGANVSDGNLQLKAAQYQCFLLQITNTAGTLQHRIVSEFVNLNLPNHAGKITGASATLANTPSVAAGVNFTSGAGIDSLATQQFIFNTAAQIVLDFATMALVEVNDTTTHVLAAPTQSNRNVNGTTRWRTTLYFKNGTTGADFALTTANIASGKSLFVRVWGWIF